VLSSAKRVGGCTAPSVSDLLPAVLCYMQGVWGRADPGDMVALMGPSGQHRMVLSSDWEQRCVLHMRDSRFYDPCLCVSSSGPSMGTLERAAELLLVAACCSWLLQ